MKQPLSQELIAEFNEAKAEGARMYEEMFPERAASIAEGARFGRFREAIDGLDRLLCGQVRVDLFRFTPFQTEEPKC